MLLGAVADKNPSIPCSGVDAIGGGFILVAIPALDAHNQQGAQTRNSSIFLIAVFSIVSTTTSWRQKVFLVFCHAPKINELTQQSNLHESPTLSEPTRHGVFLEAISLCAYLVCSSGSGASGSRL